MSGKTKTKKKAAFKPSWKKRPITSPVEYINSVAISGDGKTVIGGTYFYQYGAETKHSTALSMLITVGTFAWNAKGKLLWKDTFTATEGVYWVAISRDGKWAASCGRTAPAQGFIYIYNVAAGNRVSSYNTKVRGNMVAFSDDGSTLAAGADDIFLFTRSGSTWATPQMLTPGPGDNIVSVGISSDGKWIVAGTFKGSVILVQNQAGTFNPAATWQLSNGTIHWVAMSSDGSTFAAAASDSKVHVFNTASFPATPQPMWSAPLTGCSGCRSVAVSDDGSLVSAVGNVGTAGKAFLFSNAGGAGTQLWVVATARNPNSTSMDSLGTCVTVADGYPDKTPGHPSAGHFYLFANDGTAKGKFQTSNMSWPMQISADASAITAGSDDSYVYYFAVK